MSANNSTSTAFSRNPTIASSGEYMSDNNMSPDAPQNDQQQQERKRLLHHDSVFDVDDEDDDYMDETDGDGLMAERPMFLHLVCSLHYKTQDEKILKPIAVSSLPTCLG